MTIKEALQNENPGQFHIFDSHQEGMAERGVEHQERRNLWWRGMYLKIF